MSSSHGGSLFNALIHWPTNAWPIRSVLPVSFFSVNKCPASMMILDLFISDFSAFI